jgi:hypothetical protein
MSRKYKTRDPQPTTRDPAIECDQPPPAEEQPVAPAQPNGDAPALLVIDNPVTCRRCGGIRFYRCNATRPNMTSEMMTRRKQCYDCGQWHVIQSPPTRQERARYWL